MDDNARVFGADSHAKDKKAHGSVEKGIEIPARVSRSKQFARVQHGLHINHGQAGRELNIKTEKHMNLKKEGNDMQSHPSALFPPLLHVILIFPGCSRYHGKRCVFREIENR